MGKGGSELPPAQAPTDLANASEARGRRSTCFFLPCLKNYGSPVTRGEVGHLLPKDTCRALKGQIPWQSQAKSSLCQPYGPACPMSRERGRSPRSCCEVAKGQKVGEGLVRAMNWAAAGTGARTRSLMPGAIFLNARPGSGQRAPCGGRLKTFVKGREEKPHFFFFPGDEAWGKISLQQ